MNMDVSVATQQALGYVTTLPVEVVAIILLTIVVFIYGIRNGKRQLVTLLLAELIAFPLLQIFPYTDLIPIEHQLFLDLETVPLLTYLFFILIAYISFNRFIDTDFPRMKMNRLVQSAILSIAVVGNLLIVIYTISSNGEVSLITFLDTFFSTASYIFWWIIGSLVVLFYASR
jgi:hypothetical protein